MCTFIINKEFTIGSQLSPCGHLAITDTPLIRTTPESPAKIRHLTETNSRYCAISLLRTYGHLSLSLQHSFTVLTLVIKDINQHLSTFRQYYLNLFFLNLFVSVTLVEKWTFRLPFNIILLRNYHTYLLFLGTSNFSVTVVVNEGEMQLLFCYDLFRL